jgi:DNA-binding NtrC family response regulator
LLSGSRTLDLEDLHFDLPVEPEAVGSSPIKTLEEIERQYIGLVLFREGGRVEAAAKKLGIPRSSLYGKIKRYGITRRGLGHSADPPADRA